MTLQIPSNSKDLADLQSVVLQAFNIPPSHWPRVLSQLSQKNFRILRSENEIVGAFGLYESEQWFGGKPVSSAGVACVAVPVVHRRSGHGHSLMRHYLSDAHEAHVGLSSLYPSSDPFYRRLGYGQGGDRVQRQLSSLPSISSEGTLPICVLDPTNSTDFDEIVRLHLERARLGSGCFSRNPGLWSRLITCPGGTVRFYGLGQRSALEGWVCVTQIQGGSPFPLIFADQVILTPAAAHTMWHLASLHKPTAGELRWYGPAKDALNLSLPQSDWTLHKPCLWMLRLVHLKTALESRGYPPELQAELPFSLTDPVISANTGHWLLKVRDGQAILEPGEPGGMRLGMSALSTLYSGYHTAQVLQQTGSIESEEQHIQAADALFRGPEPYCPDVF